MVKILFVCHGNMRTQSEKALQYNDFLDFTTMIYANFYANCRKIYS